MLNKKENIQNELILFTLEDLVPEDSLYRKIDKYIDFSFIYDEVKDLYCEDNGRPSIDPVVLFKLVFIEALDGLKSMRKTCEKINRIKYYYVKKIQTEIIKIIEKTLS